MTATPRADRNLANPTAPSMIKARPSKSAQSPTTGQEEERTVPRHENPQPGQADQYAEQSSAALRPGPPRRGQQGGGNAPASASAPVSPSISMRRRRRRSATSWRATAPRGSIMSTFNLSVGARAEHVHYRPLPANWSRSSRNTGATIMSSPTTIVIIEPRTREIVTVVAASGGEGDAFPPITPGSIHAGACRLYRRHARRRPITRSIDVRVGERISADIDLMPLPQAILRESPDFGEYRYFVVNREVVLVDPQTREIVDVIRE